METMKIKTPQGDIPLLELVEYEMKRGPVNINRFNGRREVRVNADMVDPDASVTDVLEARFRAEIIPEMKVMFPGLNIEFQGQQRESQRNMADIANIMFPLAFLADDFYTDDQFQVV
jgi:multidrug efflux pump subunit AcrB